MKYHPLLPQGDRGDRNSHGVLGLTLNSPVTLGVMTSYNHLRPENAQWSLAVFWKLSTIMRWSLPMLGGPLCDQLGHSEVLCSLLSVGECRTMVFSNRHKVSMVFSSRQPLIVSYWSVTLVGDRPNTTKLCFLSTIGQQPVGSRPVKDYY